jgi:heme/copper-type cytochrome/quinol oxidase subunit 2
MSGRVFLRSLLALMLTFAVVTIGQACPTCKDAMAEGSQSAGMAEGYFWSILFMMSMPFLILGGLGGYFYLQVRMARAATASALAPHIRRSEPIAPGGAPPS